MLQKWCCAGPRGHPFFEFHVMLLSSNPGGLKIVSRNRDAKIGPWEKQEGFTKRKKRGRRSVLTQHFW